MAPSHQFHDEQDVSAGGTWFDDDGRTICRWSFSRKTRFMSVDTTTIGRTFTPRDCDPDVLSREELKQRLPEIAFKIAQDLNQMLAALTPSF